MSDSFWEVAVDAPLSQAFTYRANKTLPSGLLKRGMSVRIPFGKQKRNGVILGPSVESLDYNIREIDEVEATRPDLPEKFLLWLEWLSEYYLHPIGQVISMAFPPLSPQKRERKSKRAPIVSATKESEHKVLNQDQRDVYEAIHSHRGFGVHLLYGVTGSGKTEVYLELLKSVLEDGKQALILVPEISLTPQLISRFARRFGAQIAVIHSHLTPRERTNQWWSIVNGEKSILIGARSALFCPMSRLGMIVVDEEHEPSFKQDESLKYHGRDAAVVLAQKYDCPIVLGSATPSLESWWNHLKGRYRLHQLSKRAQGQDLPSIEVVDLRHEREKRKTSKDENPFWMSAVLHAKIDDRIKKGEQVALFLNRRGVAQTVLCTSCGRTCSCPNCAVTLTLHGRAHLVCHYCDYHENLGESCAHCSDGDLKVLGMGTELLESDLGKIYPRARIARADRDEIRNREDLEELIESMEKGSIDILIGTQMIAKGLDFPRLTLVGLVLADVGFNLPDFRSSERSFQLISQVSGRAGRSLGVSPGEVVIQTYNPHHESIRFAQSHDYVGFAQNELNLRSDLVYPPYGKLACLRIHGLDQPSVRQAAEHIASRARALQDQFEPYRLIQVLGPAQAPLAKIRNRHRMQMLVKSPSSSILNRFCRQLLSGKSVVIRGVKVQIDIDPIHML